MRKLAESVSNVVKGYISFLTKGILSRLVHFRLGVGSDQDIGGTMLSYFPALRRTRTKEAGDVSSSLHTMPQTTHIAIVRRQSTSVGEESAAGAVSGIT
jgi:hypothetical protein